MSSIDLGTVRANNNVDIPVIVSTDTFQTVVYTLTTGTIPGGLTLSTSTGYIYGYLPYQPAYQRDYTFDIQNTRTSKITGAVAFFTNSYTLSVIGEVESTIEWVTSSTLGTIETGLVSELSVVAKQLNSDYVIKYSLIDGELPSGLSLSIDGSISGTVDYGSTGTYTFTAQASDVYKLSAIEREFTLESIETTSTQYTEIYYKPFLTREKRSYYQDFISNTFTFDPKLIYRYQDSNFGVQNNIKMVLEFGIERVNLSKYAEALANSFYKKRIYFGDIKTAIAKDSTGTVIYEVVYVDAVDDQKGADFVFTSNGTWHPASFDNQRLQLRSLTLSNGSDIGINEDSTPKYMQTPQGESYLQPYYLAVIPLCYALPGLGKKIISRINLSGFDFKLINFEVDRLIVQKSKDSTSAKYLMFQQRGIST
jgi:hypothetical protein